MQVETRSPVVSKTVRECRKKPPRPGQKATQKDVAVYVIGLEHAHADCEAKVKTVDKVLTEFEQGTGQGSPVQLAPK